jgi:beta-1,4-mannosyl-glycoprotein beta-1,4-N-acetylglucosaminyltransferase
VELIGQRTALSLDILILNLKMKIVDGFTFYNEMDMLTYRLNILNDVVDYFIIVESTHTHVGNPKPLFFEENKQKFVQFSHKIVHIIVDDLPFKAPNINYQNSEQWMNEHFQRAAIQRGLDKIQLDNEDCLIVSDLDEIPDPNVLKRIRDGNNPITVAKLGMDLYYYNLVSKFDNCVWNHPVISTYKTFKKLGLTCHQVRFHNCESIYPAGWHLSYFGDTTFIKNKIQQFAHTELNRKEVTTTENIEKSIHDSSDVFHRGHKIVKVPISENKYLPHQYEIYLSKFLG